MKRFFKPEYCVLAAILFFTFALFLLRQSNSDLLSIVFSNFKSFGVTWKLFVFFFAYYIFLAIMLNAARFFLRLLRRDSAHADSAREFNLYSFRNNLRKFFWHVLLSGVPVMIALYLFGIALGALSMVRASSLADELLMRADFFLTGSYPFIFLGNILYPAWFVKAIDALYLYLPAVLLFFTIWLFNERQKLFREYAAAFFISLMTMFAVWWMFPALTPRQRFVDNVYRLPVSSSVQPALSSYRPQKEVVSFLDNVRGEEKDLSVFVVSNMPSAHIAWAALLVYYAYRVAPWLLIGAIPFALFSSYGTLLFAQHYFVDIPSGLLASLLSIMLVRWMGRLNRKEEYIH